MGNEVKDAALKFLEELEDSGKLKSETAELVQKLHFNLSAEKISQELQNEIFKTIENLKKEYFSLGFSAGKVFE